MQEPGFAPLTRILRECVLDHWLIAPGETLMGDIVAERRLHSVATAAQETGLGVEVTERLLVEAGAVPEWDDRPPSRRLFAARLYAELLAEIPTLVGPRDRRAAMGATKTELAALEVEGLLVPRTRDAKVKNPWRISDGLTFVDALSARATPVAADDDAWETLLLARQRTQVSLANLVAAVRAGRLVVGQRTGVPVFHGLVLRASDADALPPTHDRARAPLDVNTTGMTSAAAFGRSIGLRDDGNFIALIEAGPRLQHDLRPPVHGNRVPPERPARSAGRTRVGRFAPDGCFSDRSTCGRRSSRRSSAPKSLIRGPTSEKGRSITPKTAGPC